MKKIILITITSLFFVGCNSGTSGTSIPITAECSTTNDMTNYQTLQSGDKVGGEEILNTSSTKPEVEILHTANGEKKVCIKSGTAFIFR